MCWSQNVSLILTGLGIVTTLYSYKYINILWAITIFYFTVMQIIHYLGYLVIDDCNNNLNKLLSYSNYIHISFQPAIYLLGIYGLFTTYNIINKNQLISLKYYIYLALVAGCFYLLRIIPIYYSLKKEGCVWCGNTCSFTGKQHINFSLPLRLEPYYFTPNLFWHFLLVFIPLLFYNNLTRVITIIFLIGAILPSVLYDLSSSESATIWCSISIIQMIITFGIIIYNKKYKLI